LQDDWRVKSNLTLNLGLRYEMTSVPTETDGKLSILRNIGDPVPHLGNPFFNNPTTKNFEPRIGFAWDPLKTGKMAVRGGAGLYDVLPLPYQFLLLTTQAGPFFEATAIGNPGAGTFFNNLPQPFPANRFGATYIDPSPKRNYVAQFNLNLQYQLTPTMTAMVAYVGSRGLHQPIVLTMPTSCSQPSLPLDTFFRKSTYSETCLRRNATNSTRMAQIRVNALHHRESMRISDLSIPCFMKAGLTTTRSNCNGQADEPRLAVSRQLHVVEECGHQLRHVSWGCLRQLHFEPAIFLQSTTQSRSIRLQCWPHAGLERSMAKYHQENRCLGRLAGLQTAGSSGLFLRLTMACHSRRRSARVAIRRDRSAAMISHFRAVSVAQMRVLDQPRQSQQLHKDRLLYCSYGARSSLF